MTIRTLADVVAYSKREATAIPSQRESLELHSSGVGEDVLQDIMYSSPAFPSSYLDAIRSIDVYGKVLGYCSLWPDAFDEKKGLAHALAEANLSDMNPHLEGMTNAKLALVAYFECLPVYVAFSNSENGWVYVQTSPDFSDRLLSARNFTQFMILAANLAEAGAGENVVADMEMRLQKLDTEQESVASWLWLAETVS